MTNHEDNKFNMYKAVNAVLEDNKTAYADIPILTEEKEELCADIERIKGHELDLQTAIKGKTSDKHTSKETAVSLLIPIKSALHSYGSKAKKAELIDITGDTEYELGRMDENKLQTTATAILDKAAENVASLVSRKITDEVISAARTAFADMETKSDKKDSGFTDRSAARLALTRDFADTDELLGHSMDMDIELIRKDHIDVYNKYFSARVIKDLGGGHSSSPDTPPAPPQG